MWGVAIPRLVQTSAANTGPTNNRSNIPVCCLTGVVALQQGLVTQGFDSILHLLSLSMPCCLSHHMMQRLISNIYSLALEVCLPLSVSDWMQQVELWGHCRALGNPRGPEDCSLTKGCIQMCCSQVCFVCSALLLLSCRNRWAYVTEFLFNVFICHCPCLSLFLLQLFSCFFHLFFFFSGLCSSSSSSSSMADTHPAKRKRELRSLPLTRVLTTQEKRLRTVFKTA